MTRRDILHCLYHVLPELASGTAYSTREVTALVAQHYDKMRLADTPPPDARAIAETILAWAKDHPELIDYTVEHRTRGYTAGKDVRRYRWRRVTAEELARDQRPVRLSLADRVDQIERALDEGARNGIIPEDWRNSR